MIKQFVAVLALLVLITACKEEKDVKPPAHLIQKEKFVQVLADIHIADALMMEERLYDQELNNNKLSYYNYIYAKHNISRPLFDSTVQFYIQHPAQYDKVYDLVLNEINKRSNNDTLTNPQDVDMRPVQRSVKTSKE